ncbi:MAG: type II toxin-antitoxin system YafQ family toxin [Gammaproteobacteria bacterium]|nr:type II toxin-antitoxin system YafQ family toxin [Gammaproteobacteria bacterium]
MKKLDRTTQFKRDVKRMQKRQKDMEKLKTAVELLLSGKDIPKKMADHPLVGNYRGTRECHLEPDWLLIYTVLEDSIRLERTGSHADLF